MRTTETELLQYFLWRDDITNLRTMETMALVFWRTMETIEQYIDERGQGRPRLEGWGSGRPQCDCKSEDPEG